MKTRRRAIDTMPPPPDSRLEILILQDQKQARERPTPWTVICKKGRNIVRLEFRSPIEAEGNTDGRIDRMLSSIPCWRAVRPTKLFVESSGENGVDVRLISHLAVDVGSTVTDLSIRDMGQAHVVELQEAFLQFGEHGKVTRLILSTLFPLVYAVSAITCLSDLTSVTLILKKQMLPEDLGNPAGNSTRQFGFHLGGLSSLSLLEKLAITVADEQCAREFLKLWINEDTVAGMMLGCASLPRLKSLDVPLFGGGARSQNAFALMLRRLPWLTILATVRDPTPEFWGYVQVAGGHKRLRKLSLCYSPLQDVGSLDAVVVSCVRDFPVLERLSLLFAGMQSTPDEIVNSLAGLQSHKSLYTLECGLLPGGTENFVKACQEVLGERIKVLAIPSAR